MFLDGLFHSDTLSSSPVDYLLDNSQLTAKNSIEKWFNHFHKFDYSQCQLFVLFEFVQMKQPLTYFIFLWLHHYKIVESIDGDLLYTFSMVDQSKQTATFMLSHVVTIQISKQLGTDRVTQRIELVKTYPAT